MGLRGMWLESPVRIVGVRFAHALIESNKGKCEHFDCIRAGEYALFYSGRPSVKPVYYFRTATRILCRGHLGLKCMYVWLDDDGS